MNNFCVFIGAREAVACNLLPEEKLRLRVHLLDVVSHSLLPSCDDWNVDSFDEGISHSIGVVVGITNLAIQQIMSLSILFTRLRHFQKLLSFFLEVV